MPISIIFLEKIDEVEEGTRISVDPNYQESIENVKVLISLQFPHLNIENMDLFFKGRVLKDNETLVQKGIRGGDELQAKMKSQINQTIILLAMLILLLVIISFLVIGK
jgi:hypothetical protein